jgi:hypothetical protein
MAYPLFEIEKQNEQNQQPLASAIGAAARYQ